MYCWTSYNLLVADEVRVHFSELGIEFAVGHMVKMGLSDRFYLNFSSLDYFINKNVCFCYKNDSQNIPKSN